MDVRALPDRSTPATVFSVRRHNPATPGRAPISKIRVMTELRAITEQDGERLLGIVLGRNASAVTWRRAQIVSLSVQRIAPARIGELVGDDLATVHEVIENFNRDGFDSLDPGHPGGHTHTFAPAASIGSTAAA
jgi:hypothetical protein